MSHCPNPSRVLPIATADVAILPSRNPLSALFQDYDWADELLHARVGRDWYVKRIGDAKKAVDFGDECWSRVLMSWETWRREGKTAHRNRWPDLYLTACKSWQVPPDPAALAYHASYENVRADLKNVTGVSLSLPPAARNRTHTGTPCVELRSSPGVG